MNRNVLAATALVAAALVATGCHEAPTAPAPSPPSLATTRYFDSYHFSAEYTTYAPCANGGLGESILVRLDGHNVVHTVVADDGTNFMLHDFGQAHGSAVGQTTGDVYRLSNVYQQTETGRAPSSGFTNTVVYVARLINQGSGVELLYRSVIHATRDASGELVVYFERESVDCG